MKLIEKMCHSHLLWMLSQPERFEQAISSYSASSPAFQFEGVAGYIETAVTFEINKLDVFTELYYAYYKVDCDRRSKWYYSICKEAGIR